MQLPRGLLKFDNTRHAWIELCSTANRSAEILIPSRGWVGISSALNLSDSNTCSTPKYIGDSIATVSPGLHTALKLSVKASRHPDVVTTSEWVILQPIPT